MTFDLTTSLRNAHRAKATFYIRIAAQMILACQDEQKRWRAMHELRKLQAFALI